MELAGPNLVAMDVHRERHPVEEKEISWRVSVYGIVVRDGKILLSRQFGDKYDLPGGGAELTESFEQTVEREVKEETGIDVRATRCVTAKENLFVWEPDAPERRQVYHSVLVYYVCEFVGGELSTDGFDGDELTYAQMAEWLPLEELGSIQQASSVDFHDVVERALQG